jgi:hypothetical protein
MLTGSRPTAQYYINSKSLQPNSQQLAADPSHSARHSPATEAKILTVNTIVPIFRRKILKPLSCQLPPPSTSAIFLAYPASLTAVLSVTRVAVAVAVAVAHTPMPRT